MLFCVLLLSGSVSQENIFKEHKTERAVSPTLLSVEEKAADSGINFKVKDMETCYMSYSEREGIIYSPQYIEVAVDVMSEDDPSKVVGTTFTTSLTYAEILTNTLMWWVLKENRRVIYTDSSQVKINVGIFAGATVGVIILLLCIQAFKYCGCDCPCGCDCDCDCPCGCDCDCDCPSGVTDSGRHGQGRNNNHPNTVEVNYAEQMEQHASEHELSMSDVSPVPEPQPDTARTDEHEATMPAESIDSVATVPENPYEEVRNDWD